MPATVTVDQAIHFGEALVRATRERGKILATVLGDKAKEFV